MIYLPFDQSSMMQSRLFSFAVLLSISVLFFCCTDNTDSPPESPFFEFLEETAVTIDTVEQASDTWEYGFTFSPFKSGKISQLGIKLPATGNFTVTLWDNSGQIPVVLASKVVNSATQHEATFNDIPEVAVVQGKKYALTILANSFYRLSKTGNDKFIFPKTVGNILVESFVESVNNTIAASLPTATNDTRVAPCVDVIFIAD